MAESFTKSPTEHILVHIEKAFILRAVKGTVFDPHGAAMSDVIVEIRDQQGRVIGKTTNAKDRFKFRRLASGSYDFKVTRNGFQSIVGEIVVSKQASGIKELILTMKFGV